MPSKAWDEIPYPDDMLKYIFENEQFCILMKISLKFVLKSPVDNKPALV